MQEVIAGDEEKTARTARLPDISIGATAGYIGQTTIFRQGLSKPTHPDMPDWSHNYNVEVTQPLYLGGKIRGTIRRATLQKQVASLYTANDQADIKLSLLRQYMDLFALYKETEVLARNIEESRRRLEDIRRLWKEGIVTRNDEIRSELQLTNDDLALREAKDNITIVSQQLDIVLGLDETLLLLPDTTLLSAGVTLGSCEAYIQQAYTHFPGRKSPATTHAWPKTTSGFREPTTCLPWQYTPATPCPARSPARWTICLPTTGTLRSAYPTASRPFTATNTKCTKRGNMSASAATRKNR